MLLSGAGVTLEGWRRLYPAIEGAATVFAWNRFGLLGSDRPRLPQTGAVVIASLREVLAYAGVDPPYVLVAHSLGGLYANLFARMYPAEVAAVMFLEATHPRDHEGLARHESQLMQALGKVLALPQRMFSDNLHSEIEAVRRTVREIAAAGSFPRVPIAVLSGAKGPPKWLASAGAAQARAGHQRELAQLSPLSEHVVASGSGHFPQLSEPGLVLQVLARLVDRAKAQARASEILARTAAARNSGPVAHCRMPQQLPTDALAAVVQPDPYPYYAHLRQERPLYFDEALGLWVATSGAAVESALAHPGLRVRPPAEPVPTALAGTPAGEVFSLLVRMNDGEFHQRNRPGVERSVARFRMADVAASAARAALELAGELDANTILGSIPVRAIARLLGVPDSQLEATTWRVMDFVNGIAPQATPDAVALAGEAASELMAQGEAQGLDKVRSANRIALMQQSLDATAGLIGNTARRVLANPDDVRGGGPDDWRAVTAEVARWDAPVQNTRRWAAADLQLEGRPIARNQCVLVVLAAANRDEALNADPDRFDPRRPLRRSLGFGSGPHACPGEAIAIEVAAAALHALDEAGHLERLFNRSSGFRPLLNARIPVFEPEEQLQPLNPL